MAVVVLTRKTFTSYLKENIDNMGIDGMLASAFLGGMDKLKSEIEKLPDEHQIHIDTKYVMAASGLIHVTDADEMIFQITLASPLKDGQQTICIKGEEYEDFIRVWRGEREYLSPGVYKVGFGLDCDKPWAKNIGPKMWAEVSEDGLTVTVKKAEPI